MPAFLKREDSGVTVEDLSFKQGPCLLPPDVPVQVDGRPFLPGSSKPGLPKYCSPPKPLFPCVFEAQKVTEAEPEVQLWAKALKPTLDEHLAKYGAVLIKGLPMNSDPVAFSAFMKEMKAEYECEKFMEGRSMTSSAVAEDVRTGSDDDPRYTIEPHNEYNVAAKERPKKLFLVCGEEPKHGCGGEWIISDSRAITEQMEPTVLNKFKTLEARYEVYYPPKATATYNNWEENIAETKEEAEAYLTRAGCDWTWNEDDSILIHRNLPAVAEHPQTGEVLWFNQIHAHHATFYKDAHPEFMDHDESVPYPVHTKYGNGEEIEEETLNHIREVVWANTVAVPLRLGDLLIVDNYAALHGRMGFSLDSPRQTFVSILYE
ncbi:hypothetical protein CYMTET_23589 [Cymbomonas tetramitiformis]|uniref:TauD/TfdA-like domain-containing protein n=1 Tax=Cymbomonas tetramitiformis TaxID=36881 RepID=A0AAE0FXW0_9CHLO|nr:hypothetical protein CYMTET_23589 [Cymbomonas tetramitiformis]